MLITMDMRIPEGLELMTDLTAAAWVEERLALWPEGPGFPVRAVVPDIFEAYARVFHPAFRGGVPVRWSEIAKEREKVVHPAMSFEGLMGSWAPAAGDVEFPLEELREEECAALATALAGFTSSPGSCWCCLWDGYGFLTQRDSDRIPKVEALRLRPDGLPTRRYLHFRGPLQAITNMRFGGEFQAPNIWWPDDRAWCVATEVDGYDTFVGGSRACIDTVLRSPRLESLEVRPDQRVDVYADTLNPLPDQDER
jgi:hypothetical protein